MREFGASFVLLAPAPDDGREAIADRGTGAHRPRRQRRAHRGRRDRVRHAVAIRRRRTGCRGRADPRERRRLARRPHHGDPGDRARRDAPAVHPDRRRTRGGSACPRRTPRRRRRRGGRNRRRIGGDGSLRDAGGGRAGRRRRAERRRAGRADEADAADEAARPPRRSPTNPARPTSRADRRPRRATTTPRRRRSPARTTPAQRHPATMTPMTPATPDDPDVRDDEAGASPRRPRSGACSGGRPTMRIDRKRALRIGGRARRIRSAAAALAVAAVGAAALVPWPEHRAEAPSVLVQPAESRQQRVCPGPLLTLGEDAAAATTASSVGSADIVTAAEPADAELERDAPRRARATPAPPRTARPVAIAAEPGAVDAGMLAGAQSQGVSSRDARRLRRRGLRRGRRRRLARRRCDRRSAAADSCCSSNPTAVAATVDVRVTGETGPVEAPSALGIIVPPGSAARALARRPRTEPRLAGRARHEHGRRDRREPRARRSSSASRRRASSSPARRRRRRRPR